MPLFLIYLPIIYLGIKNRNMLQHGAAAVFLVVAGRKAGFDSLEFLSYVLNGVVFAYIFTQLYKRRFTLFYILLFSLVSQLAFMLLCDYVPVYHKAYREIIDATTAFLTSRLHMAQPTPAYDMLQWNVLLPLSEIMKNMVTTLILTFIFYRVAEREKPKLCDFAIPDWFVWVLATGILLSIYKFTGTAGPYILMSALTFYALGGIAIIRLFFESMGTSRIGEMLFYIVQPGLLFMPVVSIGVMETWWGFRKRIKEMEKAKKNKNNNEINQ